MHLQLCNRPVLELKKELLFLILLCKVKLFNQLHRLINTVERNTRFKNVLILQSRQEKLRLKLILIEKIHALRKMRFKERCKHWSNNLRIGTLRLLQNQSRQVRKKMKIVRRNRKIYLVLNSLIMINTQEFSNSESKALTIGNYQTTRNRKNLAWINQKNLIRTPYQVIVGYSLRFHWPQNN